MRHKPTSVGHHGRVVTYRVELCVVVLQGARVVDLAVLWALSQAQPVGADQSYLRAEQGLLDIKLTLTAPNAMAVSQI